MSTEGEADETAVRAELSEIARRLAEAQEHVAAGEAVDLAGLEERVERACTGLVALPRAAAERYTQALDDMIAALDQLEETLSARAGDTDAARERRDTPAQARRAQAAYQRHKPGSP